jgi:midasin
MILCERLNNVLEPEHSLVLAEKGGWDDGNAYVIAASGFELVAAMNRGGNYGKKELSPSLRNHFTEIWLPQITLREDRRQILDTMWDSNSDLCPMGDAILDFADKLAKEVNDPRIISLRDVRVS